MMRAIFRKLVTVNAKLTSYFIKAFNGNSEGVNKKKVSQARKLNFSSLGLFIWYPLSKPHERSKTVVVHFDGGAAQTYQLAQWKDTFEYLKTQYGLEITIIHRNLMGYKYHINEIDLPAIFAPKISDLMSVYSIIKPALVLYVNHANRNFQSLIESNSIHVHIGHGESEKNSTSSHQAIAYDRVFVSGRIAIERYRSTQFEFQENRYVCIGRPQIDFIASHVSNLVSTNNRQTILYAPTWEGHDHRMAYSSVTQGGVKFVADILEAGQFNLVYRPHPALGSKDSLHRKCHNEILSLIEEHNRKKLTVNLAGHDLMGSIDHDSNEPTEDLTNFLYTYPEIDSSQINMSAESWALYDVSSRYYELWQVIDVGVFDLSAMIYDFIFIGKGCVLMDTSSELLIEAQKKSPLISSCEKIKTYEDFLSVKGNGNLTINQEIIEDYLCKATNGSYIELFYNELDKLVNLNLQRDV